MLHRMFPSGSRLSRQDMLTTIPELRSISMNSNRLRRGIIATATSVALIAGGTSVAAAADNTSSDTSTIGALQSAATNPQATGSALQGSALGAGVLGSVIHLAIWGAIVAGIYNFAVSQHVIQGQPITIPLPR